MTSPSQSTNDRSSYVIPSPSPPVDIFDFNQAERAKVTKELEARRRAYLQRPTIEGLEAFSEKNNEYGEMMEDHVADLQTVIQEQLVIAEGLERRAKLAEERRLQEFQRALERMNPAEAEAARRAERERAFRIQRQYEARLAELDDEFARIKARVRAESPYNSDDDDE